MKRSITKWVGIGLVLVLATAATYSPNNRYFEIIKNIEIFTTLYKEINTYPC